MILLRVKCLSTLFNLEIDDVDDVDDVILSERLFIIYTSSKHS
jgi:hypothetical protein